MADLETRGGGVGLLLGWNALMVLPAIDDYWSDRVDSESVGGQSQWSSERPLQQVSHQSWDLSGPLCPSLSQVTLYGLGVPEPGNQQYCVNRTSL